MKAVPEIARDGHERRLSRLAGLAARSEPRHGEPTATTFSRAGRQRMNTVHDIESCTRPHCPWEADGPNAKALAGAHPHDTATRTHPTTRCGHEGCK